MSILEVINQCSSNDLAVFLQIVKNILNMIHIIGPILLIIALVMHFIKLMSNPDDKKLMKKIANSIIATIVLFFLPTIANVVMGMVDNSYTLSACWNTTETYTPSTQYIPINDDNNKKQKLTQDPSDYEKGEKKQTNDTNNENDNNNGTKNNNGNTNPQEMGSTGIITGDLEVHFINPDSRVDAIYIKVGNQSVFIDGGFKSDGKKEIQYMQKIGVSNIDYYIGTHSHKDHIEAAPPIIQRYNIKNVLVGRETCDGSGSTPCTWYAIKGYANEQGISLSGVNSKVFKPGDVLNLGALKISCIGPMTITNGLSKGDTKQNYNSLLLRLDYGSRSFLITGDNSSSSNWKETESSFPGMLHVDVLKNAHHNGMLNESSYKLASAEYVVFTTDSNHLPSSSCINRIKKFGAKYYYIVANGNSGNVLFTSDGSQIKVMSNYNP